jgi:hypothetical protein
LKYVLPWVSSPYFTVGSAIESRFKDGRSGVDGTGIDEVNVICGMNDGEVGKLEEVGKEEVVRFVNAASGLYVVGGTSQRDMPRSLSEVIAL